MRTLRIVLLASYCTLATAPALGGGEGVAALLPWLLALAVAVLTIDILSGSPAFAPIARGAAILLLLAPVAGTAFGEWPLLRTIGLALLGLLQIPLVGGRGPPDPIPPLGRMQFSATEAIGRAMHSARDLRHDRIDTEHLLLGCLGGRWGAGTFAALGVDTEALGRSVLRLAPPAAPGRDRKMFPFGPSCTRALFLAAERADEVRGGACIRVEDLIVGLFREEDGIAHRALAEAGVTAEAIARLPASDPAVPDIFADPSRVFARLHPEVGPALGLAKRAAAELRHDFIGELHLLLGLVRAEGPARALRELGLDPAALERELLRSARAGKGRDPADQRPFAPEVLLALDRALGSAEGRGAPRIEAIDLLFALGWPGEERLRRALGRAGFRPERLASLFSPPPADEEPHLG